MPAQGLRRVTAAGRLAALAALAIGILIAMLPAAAQARAFTSTGDDLGLTVPGDHSAGDQYVETLPTIGGPRAPRRSKHPKKLPKRLAKKLNQYGGSDAGTLEQLAGSAALGEGGSSEGQRSADASANGKGSKQGRARKHKRGGSTSAVPSAAINAADRGEAGLEWLAIAILAITALSLGAVGYQRHRHRDSTGQ
jgi:hypothetical protein